MIFTLCSTTENSVPRFIHPADEGKKNGIQKLETREGHQETSASWGSIHRIPLVGMKPLEGIPESWNGLAWE